MRQGIERGPHDPAFLGPGDEEVAAARGVERAGVLGGPRPRLDPTDRK